MTAAQRHYLRTRRIDPQSLRWDDATSLGFPGHGLSEAAVLPAGQVLLADGHVHAAPDVEARARLVELREKYEAGLYDPFEES